MNSYAVDKSPADEFSLKNQAVVRDKEADYAKVTTQGVMQEYYLTLSAYPRMEAGKVGLSGLQVSMSQVGVRFDMSCVGVCSYRENG